MKDAGLADTPSVRRVRQAYFQSFRELQEADKPSNPATVAAFTTTVKRAQERGADTVLLMARGLQELVRGAGGDDGEHRGCGGQGEEVGAPPDLPDLERVQEFMDSFYQVHFVHVSVYRQLCGGLYMVFSTAVFVLKEGRKVRDFVVGMCTVIFWSIYIYLSSW